MDANGKRTIMVVDDNAGVRHCIQGLLERNGYAVTAADCAETALAAIEAGACPELVILDLNMPGIGGIGFLRRTTDLKGRCRYPVLILSSRTAAEDFVRSTGAIDFVAKPCQDLTLLRTVQQVLPKPPPAGCNPATTHRVRHVQRPYYLRMVGSMARVSELCR